MPTPKQQTKVSSDPDAHELAARYECAINEYSRIAWGDNTQQPKTTKGYMPKSERVIGCSCEQFWSRRPANHQSDNRHLKIKYKVHFEVLRAIAWLIQRHRKSNNEWDIPPMTVLVNVALDLHMAANLGIWKSAWVENSDGTKGADTIYQLFHIRMEEFIGNTEREERARVATTDTVSSGLVSLE